MRFRIGLFILLVNGLPDFEMESKRDFETKLIL